MNKKIERKTENVLTTDSNGLAGMLGCGLATAIKIGNEAGARIQMGKRVLYKVSKVEDYLNACAGK